MFPTLKNLMCNSKLNWMKSLGEFQMSGIKNFQNEYKNHKQILKTVRSPAKIRRMKGYFIQFVLPRYSTLDLTSIPTNRLPHSLRVLVLFSRRQIKEMRRLIKQLFNNGYK